MALNQSSDKKPEHKPKGHLRYESLLKAMPPDILHELAKRKLEEIEQITGKHTGGDGAKAE